jgi:hypothetical protein
VNELLSFWIVFILALVGFAYSLMMKRWSARVVAAMAVMASGELIANAGSISGFGWGVDVAISAALLFTARKQAQLAMLSGVSGLDLGFFAILLYGVATSIVGVVLYPGVSIIRLGCMLLLYIAGARVVGGSARTDNGSRAAARAAVIAGSVAPGALIVLVTTISGVSRLGSDARFDPSIQVQLGTFSAPRLLNNALGATFLGQSSAIVLIVVTFAFFRTRSTSLRTLAVTAWVVYLGAVFWSSTRTAMIAGWICSCGTLMVFAVAARYRRARHRARWVLAMALMLPLGNTASVARFINRSSDGTTLELSDLYQSGRGKYADNVFRWIGDGRNDAIWGAGLGASIEVTRSIATSSTIQRDSGYGLIEPFFILVMFEWGMVGGVIYACYWLWLSWRLVRMDIRDLRAGVPWAGLVTCWLLYVWASSVTSFGFGIVNNTVLLMFSMSRITLGRAGYRAPTYQHTMLPPRRAACCLDSASLH